MKGSNFLSRVSRNSCYTWNNLMTWKMCIVWEKSKKKPIKLAEGSYLNFSEGTAPRGISHTGQFSNSSSANFLFMHFLQTAKEFQKLNLSENFNWFNGLKRTKKKNLFMSNKQQINVQKTKKKKMSKLCDMKRRLES